MKRAGAFLRTALLLAACPAIALVMASGPVVHGAPTGRQSTDRQADLVDALLAEGLIDDAEALCRRYLSRAPRGSETAAIWSIRLSSVLVARAQQQGPQEQGAQEQGSGQPGSDGEAAWDAARRPVAEALAGYESAPAAPWLRLQDLLVGLSRAETYVVRLLPGAAEADLAEKTLAGLTATTRGLGQLDRQLEELIPLAGTERLPDGASQSDLLALQQTVRRRMVDALLMRSEVYPPESDDALAAATEAEQAAEELLGSMPPDSPYRESVVRMLAESYRRAQRPQDAVNLLSGPVVDRGHAEPETVAQYVLAELQLGNAEAAEQALQRYYGSTPAEAPLSVAMDLARLRYLISQSDTASNPQRDDIAAWVEAIGRRGGAYARRRAEGVMLQSLAATPSDGNVTLLVAQAGQMLRAGQSGQALEAARLLRKASELSAAAGQRPRAFELAAQAGAAMVQGGKPAAASDVFAQAASAHPDQPQASAVHFEAARLQSELLAKNPADADQTLQRIEKLLAEQLDLWPESREAFAAREWLLRILRAAKRFDQAALVATRLPADSPEWEKALPLAGQLWREAIAQQPAGPQREALARQAIMALRSLAGEQAARNEKIRVLALEQANLLAVLVAEPSTLPGLWVELPSGEATTETVSVQPFAADLARVRLQGVNPQAVALNPPAVEGRDLIVDLALARLRADALLAPGKWDLAGRTMLRIADGQGPGDTQRQVLLAEATAWTGQWSEAAERLDQLARGPEAPAIMRRAAELLSGLDSADARAKGVELWNRLAAGLPKGSQAWHEARLGAAEALASAGKQDDARKLVQYVLLTQPPQAPEIKARYEALLR